MYKVHFLNVGHGDCVIVHFPARITNQHNNEERIMMVDINHHEESEDYENVIEYYKSNFVDSDGKIKPMFRFVCTHPHKDHIKGLKELFEDNDIAIWNFWDIENRFEPEEFENDEHVGDWEKYEEIRKSDSKPTVIITNREDTPRLYWNDDEDRIKIISPSTELIHDVHSPRQDGSESEPHDIDIDEISYSLLLRFNSVKLYLAGDGKEKCLNDIYENCRTDLNNINILRAGHHGQESGFHEDLIKHMNPEYVIFSNSESEDGDHGSANLFTQSVPEATILKTCNHGTIVLNVDFENNYHFENSNGQRI